MRKVMVSAACALAFVGLGTTLAAGGTSAPESGRWGLGSDSAAAPARAADGAAEARAQGSGDGDNGDGRRLVLIEVEGEDFLVITDVGEQGDFGPGDTSLFHDPLFNERETEQVGDLHVKCTVSFGPALCWGVAELRRGKISFAGTTTGSSSSGFLLALTGGTGAYKTVGGQVLVAPLREGAFKLTFEIIPLGGERDRGDD